MYHDRRFTSQKIARRLGLITGLVARRVQPLEPFRFLALDGPEDDAPSTIAGDAGTIIAPNTYWGGQNVDFALYGSFTVPADFAADRLALVLPIGDARTFSHPEALVTIDGQPIAGVDRHHPSVPIDGRYADGQAHTLALRGWIGMVDAIPGEPGKQVFMRECAVVEIDPPTRALVALTRTALMAADLLNETDPIQTRLYNALDDAFKRLDTREPFGDAFYASVPPVLETLRADIAAAGPPLDVDVIAVGHAHIDVAWLWTLGQTRRKAQRTFYNVLQQMDEFPNFHFTQSQPQLYDYIRQDDPALFEAIKARVADGRWEPIGGAWVEPDCNISGGESLVRQLMLGRAFFREHFGAGAESPVLWLPDVFGYAANLPQLIKLAGLEYFFTIKLGWNQTNKLPYDSFWWQGLDGTRVLTHFSTTPGLPWDGQKPDLLSMATYNADLSAFAALGTWAKLKHKESQRTMLMAYGYGDGGGGPTREMNENAVELDAMPGVPRLEQGKVIDFFKRLEAESGTRLPTWNGELYLELHRGTYTTQSRNKRANRKMEVLLHDAEFLATYASLIDPTYDYPYADLRRAWELICLNQFHDIIPGSSIGPVYVESLAQYEEVRTIGEAVCAAAQAVLTAHVGGDVVIVNPSDAYIKGPVFWPGVVPEGKRLQRPGKKEAVHTQAVEGGTLIADAGMSGYSVLPLSIVDNAEPLPREVSFGLFAEPRSLENALLRVELNDAGDIIRIYDKGRHREILPVGAVANQFQAFEDRPLEWDAWDIDTFYDDKMYLAEPADSIRVVESGPLRATIEIERRILNSRYTQRLSTTVDSLQLDISTVIDWREKHILLKVAFPVNILASKATYDVQWGSVQRPTHKNTSWDWARFETCAHKWVDLSEGDYGVALLNDCKYGHDIHGNVIRLSLLRSTTYPDPNADQGEHRFSYALLPHQWLFNHVIVQAANEFNNPALAISATDNTFALSEVALVSARHIYIETIKRAEDGDGWIVRAYKDYDRRPATFHFSVPVKSVHITNLLEEDQKVLDVEKNTDGLDSVSVTVTPFQILTLRIR